LSDNFVYEIYEDRSHVLWVGTFTGGLNRLVPGDHKGAPATFVSYQTNPHDSSSLSNKCVLAIYEDRAGNLWIATAGGGINKFNRQAGTFTRYTEENGLANNFVYGILEDEQQSLAQHQ
jgi:ligand-binding sensor domain-containing protein